MDSPDNNDAPTPPAKVFEAHIVKVTLPMGGGLEQALVHNEGRSLQMLSPAGLLAKRFRKGEWQGFFKAELDANGILEIGDRVAARDW